MKSVTLLIILSCGISLISAAKVTKCTTSLQGSVPRGVEVDDATNKVTFPPTTRDPTAQSKISTVYDKKGLDAFFDLAKSFMNTVQKKDFPELKDANGKFDFDEKAKELQNRKGVLYDFELPIVVCFGVGIVFALLMPLIGCCFCCCRCCGKCGGDMSQDDKAANSHCKCCIFAIILIIATLFMMTGAAMMFATNSNLETEVAGTAKTYDNALSEAWSFLDNVKRDLKEITVNKTNCLYEDLLVPDISDTGIRDLVGKPLKSTLGTHLLGPLDAVSRASSNVSAMNSALDLVANTSASLKSSATQLESELQKTRDELERIKTECNTALPSACDSIDTTGLRQVANFSNLPSVDDELKNIRDIVGQNFSGSVNEARKVFDDIPETVVSKSSSSLKDVRKTAKDGKEKLVNQTNDIFDKLDNIIKDKSKFENYKKDYITPYTDKDNLRFYGFVGLASLMTLIVALLLFGLLCGICTYDRSKTPTNRSSVSHHGGNMIMASVGFMFIFSFIFFLLTALCFVLGQHMHILCREVKDAQIIDKYAGDQLKYNGTKIIAGNVLKNCRKGQPIYTAINGKSVFNLNDKLNFSKLVDIDKTLDGIKVNLSDQTILNADTEKSLNDLKNSSVEKINFTSFFVEIRQSIVAVNLTDFALNLTRFANSLNDSLHPNLTRTKRDLLYVAGNLTQMDRTTIKQIGGWTNQLEINLEDVKAKSSGLQNVTQNILDELRKADNYVKTTAGDDVKTLIKSFVNRVLGWMDQFIKHVLHELDTNIANCKPLANVYDGIINTYLCDGIIGNFNGFWFAMGWCLFFFPFAIIFGVKLAKFLRIMKSKDAFDPYPGYEMQQHPVKLPMSDYAGHGASAAPPPYVG